MRKLRAHVTSNAHRILVNVPPERAAASLPVLQTLDSGTVVIAFFAG
jgi:hypothetical protein